MMSRDANPFTLDRIHIRRTPGIQTPGLEIGDRLSPGINVIHGPNASGKSTTARCIGYLLWPDSMPQATVDEVSVVGQWVDRDNRWLVDLDHGGRRIQRDGVDDRFADLPPMTVRDRYHLALHDLIQQENTNATFAREILRESTGGYDLSSAEKELQFRSKPSRSTTKSKDVSKARRLITQTESGQKQLQMEQTKLTDLVGKREKLATAGQRAELLARVIAYRQAAEQLKQAKDTFETFPFTLRLMTGEELTLIRDTDARIQSLKERRSRLESQLEAARKQVAESSLPEEGIDSRVTETLANLSRELDDQQREYDACEQRLRGLRDAVDRERKRIGRDDLVAAASHATVDTVDRIEQLFRKAESVRADQAACDRAQQWLKAVPTDESGSDIHQGIQLLRAWLREAEFEPPQESVTAVSPATKWTFIGYHAVVVVAGLVLALVHHWSWSLVSLVVLIGGLVVAKLTGRRVREAPESPDYRALRQTDYQRLSLPQPESWSQDTVTATLNELEQANAQSVLQAEKLHRWEELVGKRESLERSLDELIQLRMTVEQELGLDLAMDEGALHFLVHGLLRYQDAVTELESASAEQEAVQTRLARLLEGINEKLNAYGMSADDRASCRAVVNDLSKRADAYRSAMQQIEQAQDELTQINKQLDEAVASRVAVFDKLSIEPGDDAALKELAGKLQAYTAAKKAVEVAEVVCRERLTLTRSHPLFDESILENAGDVADLESEHDSLVAAADELKALDTHIKEIEARINVAKEQHDLEDALAGYDVACAALHDQQEDDLDAVVGFAILDYLREETRDKSRPRVFHRAKELFGRITRGRYDLDFSDANEAAFYAIDSNTGVGHSLDELSSGTRVQLLMAVRVAFVETQEHGYRLPLIFDETLANSDDVRARAIIEGLIEIARSGRQIFYFTAQDDEVGKWRAILSDSLDVPSFAIIDLAEVRGQTNRELLQDRSTSPVRATPRALDIEGHTRQSYGEAIGVPPIDPWGEVDGVHVWHLTKDLSLLYRILSLHVRTWGEVKRMQQYAGETFLPEQTFSQLSDVADTLSIAVRTWRIGRSRPIDRGVLVAASVSEKFIDQLADGLEDCAGDASQMLESLDVKGFGTQKKDKLRMYLEEHGYISSDTVLDSDELCRRVLVQRNDLIESGRLSRDTVDGLIHSLPTTDVDETIDG